MATYLAEFLQMSLEDVTIDNIRHLSPDDLRNTVQNSLQTDDVAREYETSEVIGWVVLRD